MSRTLWNIAVLSALLLASPAAFADDDGGDDASQPIWLGVGGGGGVAKFFDDDAKFVFDSSLELGFPMAAGWAFGLRVTFHGTPGTGGGVAGGLLAVRQLFSPDARFSPYLEAAGGYGIVGAGKLETGPLGRVALGGRFDASKWIYVAPEAFAAFNTKFFSAGGGLGLGLLF